MNFKKIFLLISVVLFLTMAGGALASQPKIVYWQSGSIQISNPEISQAFYDELKGQPRDYFINADKDFELYINLLVPNPANRDGRYSANIFSIEDGKENMIISTDVLSSTWQDFYNSSERDYYIKGPELTQQLSAGQYKIEVYSKDNQGKYVLIIGKKEISNIQSILSAYWQLPLLKVEFFETPILQFFLTSLGIAGIVFLGALLIFLALIYYLIGFIKKTIKHNQAKTLLLTSGGMRTMQDEIIKFLLKPSYDVTVGFITTAYKYKLEDDPEYRNEDLRIMREIGFNVEEIDIEGKSEGQIMKLLELKDIIFVAGGNTFYLLNAMRGCHFEKVIRRLLKWGKVYIGVSAGSIVAGRTIKTASWKDVPTSSRILDASGIGTDKNVVGLKNLKGLNLVPFDIFVHYQPEHAEIIQQQIKNPKKRLKTLRILTDDQAILVQGKEIDLIGDGEQIIV